MGTAAGYNETFELGGGNDSATVLNGADVINGGEGTDTLVLDYSLNPNNYITMASPLVANGAGGYNGQISMSALRNATFTSIEHFHVTGAAYADAITTGNGNDIVFLGGGDDFVDVGSGFDSADGGTGTDGFSADFSATHAVSIDLRNAVNSGAFGSFSNFDYFGTIGGSGFGDSFVGTSAAYNETFNLGGGNDSATVLNGADVVNGGDGIDTLVVDYSANSNNFVTTGSFAANGAGGYDGQFHMNSSRHVTFTSIEHFHVTGGAYGDTLTTGNGNDHIDGSGGGDSMTGGAGNDVYVVDGFTDGVNENADEGTDEIRTAIASYSIAARPNVENLTGTGTANQTLTGNSGDNVIDGGAGADAMAGRAGNDTYVVDQAGDSVTENANEGTDGIRTSLASYSLAALANVENLTGASFSGQTLTGNGLANRIEGGTASDVIDGGAGADTMIGGMGSEVYYVDDAGDVVTEAQDIVSGPMPGGLPPVVIMSYGNDEVRTTLATYTLAANVEKLTGLLATGQTLTGNGTANTISGGAGADRISGGGGIDTLIGGDGDDLYVITDAGTITEGSGAGSGDDTVETALASFSLAGHANVENLVGTNASGQALTGSAGANRITGAAGNDTINGNGGADMLQGAAGDDVYIVDSADDTVVEYLGDGDADEVRTSVADYTIPDYVEILTYTGTGNATLRGNGGDNAFTGGAGGDMFYLDQGGTDTADGGGGNDAFLLGAFLDATDQVDGGAGTKDQLGVQGDYGTFGAGATPHMLGAANLVGIETLALMSGTETSFGAPGGGSFSYNLKTVEENVGSGQSLTVNMNGLQSGEDVIFDGSAETDGKFFFYAGAGVDKLTGGKGDDGFYFGTGQFNAGDEAHGGDGMDQLGLRGDYDVTFGEQTMTGIETLALLSGTSTRYGPPAPDYIYSITLHENNVASGATLSVNANELTATEGVVFDGTDEQDGGKFSFKGGKGNDSFTGGAGEDIAFGGLGQDVLIGGGAMDRFVYTSVAQSTGTAHDRLLDFDYAEDRIDLPGSAAFSYDGKVSGSVSSASFNDDLAALLSGRLADARDFAFVSATGGDQTGKHFLVVEANGVDGYQAGQDYVFEVTPPPVSPTPDFLM